MIVLREYEDFYNYRPHRALKHAAPLRQLPDGVTDLDQFRSSGDRAGGVIHELRRWPTMAGSGGGCPGLLSVSVQHDR